MLLIRHAEESGELPRRDNMVCSLEREMMGSEFDKIRGRYEDIAKRIV